LAIQEPWIRIRLFSSNARTRNRAIALVLGISLSLVGGDALLASTTPTTLPGSSPQTSQPTEGTGAPVPPVPTATTATPVATSLIAPGARSSLVLSLQRRLRVNGIAVKVTGTYDARTRAGVRALQRKLGLPATGIVDTTLLQTIGVKVRSVAGRTAPVVVPNPTANAAVVPIALSLLGIPYRAGGATPAGFDCSGFASYIYAQIGKPVPHYTVDIWNQFTKVPLDQLAPGDLLLMDGLGHMGVYIGDGNFVHSPKTGDVVKVTSLGSRMDDYIGAVRP